MMSLPQSFQSCIDKAQTYQRKLLDTFVDRKYASLQLVEAISYASKPTTVVELSQELPFERSYSVINKILNSFGPGLLEFKDPTIATTVNSTQNIHFTAFSKITKPFSDLFFEMIPKESSRKFRLYALDATSNARIHADTLDDRSYVHQANQVGIPVTIGLQASVLAYLPETSAEEANWQLPLSVERISTDSIPCATAKKQLKLLAELTPVDTGLLTKFCRL